MIARAACGALGAVISVTVWLFTGWTDSVGIAVLVTVIVAVVCFVIGPPVVEALTGVDLDDLLDGTDQ